MPFQRLLKIPFDSEAKLKGFAPSVFDNFGPFWVNEASSVSLQICFVLLEIKIWKIQ